MLSIRGRTRRLLIVFLILLLVVAPAASAGAQEDPVVHAVLFFSPSCGHCEFVIQQYLFPIEFPGTGGEAEIYYDESLAPEDTAFYIVTNGRLEMLFVDVTIQAGSDLFGAATVAYDIASNGVPRLLVGDQYFIGSGDIPEQFPGIVAAGLAGTGIDWPEVEGLAAAVASVPVGAGPAETTTTTSTEPGETTTTTSGPSDTTTTTTTGAEEATTTTAAPTTTAGETTTTTRPNFSAEEPSVWERFGDDAVGNTIATIVLVAILAALVWGVLQIRGRGAGPGRAWDLIPLLLLAGIAVAAYLFSVESGGEGAKAVCGPVGDCNAVQNSKYARLFGAIHIGLVGVIGYAVALGTWALGRFAPARVADWARVALFAASLGGVAFSIYLTFLEPFVIGATCMWCVTSAVVMTVVMLLAARPGVAAWHRLRSAD